MGTMKKRLLLAGAAVVATMYGGAASAQEVDVTNVDDIVVTGSIQLTHALIEADLVDEYRLFVFPAIVGHGGRLFEGTIDVPSLRLQESRAFPTGVVLNVYEVQR